MTGPCGNSPGFFAAGSIPIEKEIYGARGLPVLPGELRRSRVGPGRLRRKQISRTHSADGDTWAAVTLSERAQASPLAKRACASKPFRSKIHGLNVRSCRLWNARHDRISPPVLPVLPAVGDVDSPVAPANAAVESKRTQVLHPEPPIASALPPVHPHRIR